MSIFFVLSGFVLVYRYYNSRELDNCSIINNLKFAIKKIKKLYLLHILCMLAMMIFFFVGDKKETINYEFLLRIILNCLLLQEWFPFESRSINGVSWFLCTILLGYFIFPWILKLFKNNYSTKKSAIFIIMSIGFEVFGGLLSLILTTHNLFLDDNLWTNNFFSWIGYYFPLTRVWEIIIGFNLGYIFINRNKKTLSQINVNLFETVGIICTIISSYLYGYMSSKAQCINTMASSSERWWTFSLIFIPSSIILTYTFAFQCGYVSKLLTNKITEYLAKISPYGFLIHFVVYKYISVICYRIPGNNHQFIEQYGAWCNITFGIAISLICSQLYLYFYQKR